MRYRRAAAFAMSLFMTLGTLTSCAQSNENNKNSNNIKNETAYEYNISDENWANQKSYCEQNVARGNSSYESRIDEVLDIIPEDAYLKFEPTNNSYGGAIYNISKEPLVVINTQFDNNSSTGFGGAIANLGEFNNDIGDLTARLVLDNTTFNKNNFFW